MKKSKTWILLATGGALLISAGTYIFLWPWHGYWQMVKFTGVVLLLNSLSLFMTAGINNGYHKERGWLIMEGILDTVFGALFLLNPLFTFLVFPYLIGMWAIGWGAIKISFSATERKVTGQWAFMTAEGVIAVLFGYLISYKPFARYTSDTALIAAFLIITGVIIILDAFRFRNGSPKNSLLL